MAAKLDLKRTLDCYRARAGRFEVVEVPDLQYLMIDGHGDPNSPAFAEAVSALYPLAYRLKFTSARELGRGYVVMPLEGLWWAEDMDSFTARREKSSWDWTVMLMLPHWHTAAMVAAAVEQVAAKNPPDRLDEVRLQTLQEGRCVQTLHVGAFDDETEVLREMHEEVIPGQGLTMTGRHHEIYLSDPRRTTPARRRTILRQPVRAAG